MLEKIMNLHLLLYAMIVLGGLGALGMLATHLTYRRLIRKNTELKSNLKEKWMNLWKTRDKLLNRMNRLVWYPSLFCTALLGLAFFLYSENMRWDGMPLAYLYVGAIIPAALLLLRQALDFTYKEELLMNEEGLQDTENKLIHIGKPIEFDEMQFYLQLIKILL